MPLPPDNGAGRFLAGAMEEFAQADAGRQSLEEAHRLAAAGRYDDAYRLLRSGMRRTGRWRPEAAVGLVEIALAGGEPRPKLSDEFAELVRIAKGGGQSLLPVLEIFELAGHEERKELLFDHVGQARDASVGDVVQSERLHTASERGQWLAGTPSLVQIAGKARHKCFALWETCAALVFAEREPWSVAQLDGKVLLPDWLSPLMRPLLELKVARALAARPGAALRLPRAAPNAPAFALRAVLEGLCRPNCPLRELPALWADVALLVSGQKAAIPQAEIIDRLAGIRDAESPSGICKTLPRDAFLRRRIDSRLRRLADLLLAELGHARRPASVPKDMTAVPAGTIKGRAMGIPAFLIGDAPVTRAQYARFDPSVELRRGEESRPMTNLNWFQARAYARHVGGRLPRVCEWWLAVKAGAVPAPAPTAAPGAPADLPEAEPPLSEWSDDWMLAGAEKVRLNWTGRSPAGATAGPGESGLAPTDKDPNLGFRVVI